MADQNGEKVIPKRGSWILQGARDTLAFGSDPVAFVNNGILRYGPMFQASMVGVPSVFATSYADVTEVMDSPAMFGNDAGYSDLLARILGSSGMVVQDGSEYERQRATLSPIFDETEDGVSYAFILSAIIPFVNKWKESTFPLIFYEETKQLSNDVLGELFLNLASTGVRESEVETLRIGSSTVFDDDTDDISDAQAVDTSVRTTIGGTIAPLLSSAIRLQTIMWRGIMSLPVAIRFGSVKSAFARGLEAKESMYSLVNAQIEQSRAEGAVTPRCPFAKMLQSGLSDEEVGANSIMFTSSLTTKATASLLTSLAAALCNPRHREVLDRARQEQREVLGASFGDLSSLSYAALTRMPYLDAVISEVERLWPPVFGTIRGVGAEGPAGVVNGYTVPPGTKVWNVIYTANRDPAVFTDPETFLPKRWLCEDPPRHFSFGGTARPCMGRAMMQTLVKIVGVGLLGMQFGAPTNQNMEYRWLPVARPADGLRLLFRPMAVEGVVSGSSATSGVGGGGGGVVAQQQEDDDDDY